MMRALQAIVFDFDGVIADSEALHLRAYQEVLGRADLKRYFSAIVGADRVQRSKPAPDTYLEAFMILSASAGTPIVRERTVAIEDSYWGLESARAAGLRLVGVANTYAPSALAPVAELVVTGRDALTLTALDALCETEPKINQTLRGARP